MNSVLVRTWRVLAKTVTFDVFYIYTVIYIYYVDTSLRTTNSVTSNNTSICNLTSSNDDINNSAVTTTSTIDVTMTSTTTNHPISSNTPYNNFNTTSTTNSSDHLSSKPVIAYPVIASCLAGGLLGLCFIVCIVGFMVKRKLHKTNSTSPVNLLFDRYI